MFNSVTGPELVNEATPPSSLEHPVKTMSEISSAPGESSYRHPPVSLVARPTEVPFKIVPFLNPLFPVMVSKVNARPEEAQSRVASFMSSTHDAAPDVGTAPNPALMVQSV